MYKWQQSNLSVGAGTFQPVKVDNIEDHDIHSEYLEVSDDVVALVKATKKAGRKVFAVGTTATRALETAFIEDNDRGYSGYTKLFIYPGYTFKAVDRLITNFHLPQSSLLMLVSAFMAMTICDIYIKLLLIWNIDFYHTAMQCF